MIENALKMAKSAISLEERMKDPLFEESYQRLRAAVADHRDEAPGQKRLGRHPAPSFSAATATRTTSSRRPSSALFEALREEREAFLSVVHSELSSNAVLRRHFLASLEERDGGRYLPALDPSSSWTRH